MQKESARKRIYQKSMCYPKKVQFACSLKSIPNVYQESLMGRFKVIEVECEVKMSQMTSPETQKNDGLHAQSRQIKTGAILPITKMQIYILFHALHCLLVCFTLYFYYLGLPDSDYLRTQPNQSACTTSRHVIHRFRISHTKT